MEKIKRNPSSPVLLVACLLATVSAQDYRIAFGSCWRHRYIGTNSSQAFTHIMNLKPDSFVWLGDVAYLDTYDNLGSKKKFQLGEIEESKERLKESYNDESKTKS